MDHLERARALRAETAVHYNCAQSVLVPFAQQLGLSEAQAFNLGAHFGSGMRHGSTCGAVSAALMALGMMGCGEAQARELLSTFRANHGALDCAQLLKTAHEQGVERKCHCDGLVLEMVAWLDSLKAAQEG